MANEGVIPLETASGLSSAPLKNKLPAPLRSEPMPKCVIEFVPPVAAGKFTAAAFETFAPLIVQPAPERATATRA